jgi:hypothetical protein
MAASRTVREKSMDADITSQNGHGRMFTDDPLKIQNPSTEIHTTPSGTEDTDAALIGIGTLPMGRIL